MNTKHNENILHQLAKIKQQEITHDGITNRLQHCEGPSCSGTQYQILVKPGTTYIRHGA